MSSETFSGLKLRCIGPAFMSGRIGDIAVNPNNPADYYLAVASGGVWKTKCRHHLVAGVRRAGLVLDRLPDRSIPATRTPSGWGPARTTASARRLG